MDCKSIFASILSVAVGLFIGFIGILLVILLWAIKLGIIGLAIYFIIWLFFPDSSVMMSINSVLGISD